MKIEMIGKTFGQLTVLKFVGTRNNSRNLLWECKCTCGNTTITTGSRLRALHTKSCGCLIPSRLRTRNHGWEIGDQNLLYAQYKSQAKSRELDFTLDKKQFNFLTKCNCDYCNSYSDNINSNKIKYGNHFYSYNGLDRVDNTIGYTWQNVVPCCSICNTMKFDLPLNQFLEHIKKIAIERNL